MKITTVGIDLAKNVFQVHGVDEHGKAMQARPDGRVLRKSGVPGATEQKVQLIL